MAMDAEWDQFVDWCTENDLDPAEEDFWSWREDENVRVQDALADLNFRYAKEREHGFHD